MKLPALLVLLLVLKSSAPAMADDVAAVTVLRGASAPSPVAAPPVIVQTVVVPEVVYVPTNSYFYPAFGFYPGYVIQNRRFFGAQVSTTGLSHGHAK